jgi:hypothetical protein
MFVILSNLKQLYHPPQLHNKSNEMMTVFHPVTRNKRMTVQWCKDRAVRWMFWRVSLGELFNETVSCSDYIMLVRGE